MLRLLLRIGIVRRDRDTGAVRWPVHVAPLWIWKATLRHPIAAGKTYSTWPIYVFRNLPGVVKWKPGRLLPVRWGIGFMGLIEFGDRG